jgi:molybdopterin molybdotransferase
MKRTYSPAPSQRAFDWIDEWTITPSIQQLPLLQATGYRLAQDIHADNDIPALAVCARDGFALAAADTLGAGDYNPLPLQLLRPDETLLPNSAIQVSSGDPLPTGADAVLPLDQADVRNKLLDVACSLAPGDGVIQQGEECHQQETLLHAGSRLRPQDLARLAQAGISTVSVNNKPRVQLFIAGHFEHNANGPMLSALITRDGGDLTSTILTSSTEELAQGLSQSDAELILVTGSSGYGASDYAVQVLHAHGQIDLDGVSIHPGGAVVLGKFCDRPILLLPGSTMACLCAYELIAARLLRRLAAKPDKLPYRRQTFTLSRKLVSRIGQFELARMRIDGNYTEPLAVADDRLLSSSVRAHGFVLLPENSEGYAAGSQVEVYLYDEFN